MSGKRIDLREGINGCSIDMTNLFFSPGWAGGVGNKEMEAAIDYLERAALLGDGLNPLEKFAAQVLVLHWQTITGRKIEGQSDAA